MSACVSTPERNPLPEQYVDEAAIAGIPAARIWGDESPPDYEERLARTKEQRLQHAADGPDEIFDALALLGSRGCTGLGACSI